MPSPFPAGAGEAGGAVLAARLAPPAEAGRYDELRGITSEGPLTADRPLAPAWTTFFDHLGGGGFADLDQRMRHLQRQVHDHDVSYNVHSDPDTPQRPWPLELLPLVLSAQDWAAIEAGVLQRMRLLEALMADAYGPQRLLQAGLLPSALLHGHPGYLRPLHGATLAGRTWLPIAAFDLGRDPQGRWHVVAQRTQAPSGLGYLLENRAVVSRLFPQAFAALQVRRLAGTFGALLEALQAMCATADGEPCIVLLTPGPYHETHFEHALLARSLGLPLVEGSDLTVRGGGLYLKTLDGLAPVHGVFKRVDDDFLDPLELRPDSRLGVPGLLQAIRAGRVLLANAPGSGWLESPALAGFLPALARQLLGEELALPSLPAWWCGERVAVPRLPASEILSTFGHGEPVAGASLSRRDLDAWTTRLEQDPEAYTVRAPARLSQVPTWQRGRIAPCPWMLRVFAVAAGPGRWRVLPGGLARLGAGTGGSMARGGSSADVWVQGPGAADPVSARPDRPARRPGGTAVVTSRSAENLFWLGRYTERTENTARLARLALQALDGEIDASTPLLAWLGELCAEQGLVAPDVPGPAAARPAYERALLAGLSDPQHATSVGFNLASARQAAAAVRDRLTPEHWRFILDAEQAFREGCAAGPHGLSAADALRALEGLAGPTAAITGAQADRMARDDGWRLLAIGRQLERLGFLASALVRGLETGAARTPAGHDALVALFGSAIAFQARYHRRRGVAALIDVLVLDGDNPRSLACVVHTLRAQLLQLTSGESPAPLASSLPDPACWSLDALEATEEHGGHGVLLAVLRECVQRAWRLSDDLGARHFARLPGGGRSVGA